MINYNKETDTDVQNRSKVTPKRKQDIKKTTRNE